MHKSISCARKETYSSMSSSSASTPKLVSYPDAIHILNEIEFRSDLRDACSQLAATQLGLLSSFDVVSTLIRRIGSQGAHLEPKWNAIRKEYRDLVWATRNNAANVSGRLKLFSQVVLPHASQISGSSRHHAEDAQMLQSYITNSAELAQSTRSMAEYSFRLNGALNSFHSNLAQLLASSVPTGQQELHHLHSKVTELQDNSKNLCCRLGSLSGMDVSLLILTAFRTVGYLQRPRISKLTRQRLAFSTPDATAISYMYSQLDQNQSEVVAVDYTLQCSQRAPEALVGVRTALSRLCIDETLSMAAILSLLQTSLARTQTDCYELNQWVQCAKTSPSTVVPPSCVASYIQTGSTLYGTLSVCLDAYVARLDPSMFS